MSVEKPSVTLKRGSMVAKMSKTDLVNIESTHDGLVFNCKGGYHIYITDNHMPNEVKTKLLAVDQAMPKGHLMIDLNDYRNPIKIQVG